MRTRPSLALVLLTAACTGSGPGADPSAPATDAGHPVDAGPAVDAGNQEPPDPDAGVDPDPDAGVIAASMALTVTDGAFTTLDGTAVDVRGAISCCGGAYGWPLYDESWADLVASHNGNFLHARLGPFLTSGNGETDWATTGGGYLEVDGRADLDQFNAAFWTRVRALLQHARDSGLYVEVDVIDGWGVKHCQAGDIPGYSAWEQAFNVQELDGCTGTGSGPVAAGSVQDLWIRKVVAETGTFDNVLYQDGNEVGLVSDYSVEWTRSMHDIIRDEEALRGYGRHLFATNAGTSDAIELPEVDYLEFHGDNALSAAQCMGKPCMVNEYNPSPPLTPAEFGQRYCSARAQGTAFMYWRHGQTHADMLTSLAAFSTPCDDPPASSLEFPAGVPDEGFIAWADAATDTDPAVDAAVNAAMAALTGCNVGSDCNLVGYAGADAHAQCQSWFAAITAELRQGGLHAGQHELGHTDEIAVSNSGCTGRWYGYHVCNYGGPKVVWNPGARRGWWQIDPGYCQ